MSKIQKALDMLRNSGESKKERPQSRDAVQDIERTAGLVKPEVSQRPAVRVRTRYVPDGGTADEALPEFKIEVDFDMLGEQGLQPQNMDVDVVAEQFRRIKRPILNTAFGVGVPDSENANVIMVASALPKTGKSFCSFNLAISVARERDVGAVLVDADVLKPNVSRAFGLDNRTGLIDYLLDPSVTMDDVLVMSDLHGIVVIPSGQQHEEATELLASRRMKQFVETLSQRFAARAIIVDTPPLLMTNEAHVLAEHMGQIVLVIEAGVSPQESVKQVLNSLNRSKPINAILNKARRISFGEYGGTGYGYRSTSRRGRQYAQDTE